MLKCWKGRVSGLMKETIYTIPLNEVYDDAKECPLCELSKKLENEAVEYALGAAMMEPDYRIESNKKGYCNRHFSMLYQNTNKLSLALVLDTHLEEFRKELFKISKAAPSENRGFLKKGNSKDFSKKLSGFLEEKEKSCVVCDKIEKNMTRYINILVEMWEKDEEFKKKFENSKGVCIPHYKELVNAAVKKLSDKKAMEFISFLSEKQNAELERIQEDIHKFTLKFDYRNAQMEWGTAKDAPIRTIEKISGNILKNE